MAVPKHRRHRPCAAFLYKRRRWQPTTIPRSGWASWGCIWALAWGRELGVKLSTRERGLPSFDTIRWLEGALLSVDMQGVCDRGVAWAIWGELIHAYYLNVRCTKKGAPCGHVKVARPFLLYQRRFTAQRVRGWWYRIWHRGLRGVRFWIRTQRLTLRVYRHWALAHCFAWLWY